MNKIYYSKKRTKMGNSLSDPILTKETFEFTNSNSLGLQVGGSAMQGRRLDMEDSHLAFHINETTTAFGVFDGHGGDGASKYISSSFVEILTSTPSWIEFAKSSHSQDLSKALGEACFQLDKSLREVQVQSCHHDSSGTTGIIVIVTPTHIVAANIGDSRAILVNCAQVGFVPLSFDHKPHNEDEHKRIEAAGGYVAYRRVNGDLAVSRAFGDFQFKTRPDLPDEEQAVTCKPEIIVYSRPEEECIVLLACDGLWDVMTNEVAAAQVHRLLEAEHPLIACASSMVDLGLSSNDNVSVILGRIPGVQGLPFEIDWTPYTLLPPQPLTPPPPLSPIPASDEESEEEPEGESEESDEEPSFMMMRCNSSS